MRESFHRELDEINQALISLGRQTEQALEAATHALLTADLPLAEKVIADDDKIDDAQHALDAKTIDLMARQSPVANDLRALVTSLRMSADLERMGDLAHHIAKLARMRFPASAVPSELLLTIQEMSRVASKIVGKAIDLISSRDASAAKVLEKDDDEMDILHRKLLATLLDDTWSHGIETAIDMTLVGRYYERFADHAVSIARRIYFLVEGEYYSDQR
ncbi:MAG: phosphate transport system regulatory protein PhoU [Actinobacteria bacterium]|uniref:Phosphate-specific transport system accessory protein PhoU n=1 Tax=Candidatus Fonsibacter lacus TaxID=2576439 RepID=A0A965LLA9_9PROT|nr:phosphate transport system regulatory protein PhoU [Candidatus Fonsibacter lacus]